MFRAWRAGLLLAFINLPLCSGSIARRALAAAGRSAGGGAPAGSSAGELSPAVASATAGWRGGLPPAQGEVHLQVSNVRESGADTRKFYIHTGVNTMPLRAETK